MWTSFIDYHSGGYPKTEFKMIYIQASRDKAIEVFKHRFGINPLASACSCCGENFGVSYGDKTLYESSLGYNLEPSLKKYCLRSDILIINRHRIKELGF